MPVLANLSHMYGDRSVKSFVTVFSLYKETLSLEPLFSYESN
jgi:hypothetical protein